jgi:RNA polymerase sigma-70 factor, ECF subfamily
VPGLVQPSAEEFERFALPHAAAALSLARALARSDADAEDIVQEAFMRAFKYFRGFSGEHPRAWLLSIVRNAAYSLLRRNEQTEPVADFDEARDAAPSPWSSEAPPETPEAALLRAVDTETVYRALGTLPPEFREVVVLRELEQCSYKEIADIAQIPIGTVMSRLSRARRLLHTRLSEGEAGRAKG